MPSGLQAPLCDMPGTLPAAVSQGAIAAVCLGKLPSVRTVVGVRYPRILVLP